MFAFRIETAFCRRKDANDDSPLRHSRVPHPRLVQYLVVGLCCPGTTACENRIRQNLLLFRVECDTSRVARTRRPQ
ncbi:DUF5374 domain-containing protein [Trinickia fusca]|uniref:DUF5374 domain-containing protein n=1 Tax=Trinickia fusca TaxID=2419777 RepID=UPI001C7D8ACF